MGVLRNNVEIAKPIFGGVSYNALLAGKRIWIPKAPVVTSQFAFVINSGVTGTFIIPTSNSSNSVYNWIINWGDGSSLQTVSGTSAMMDTTGIAHTFPQANREYIIGIDPVSDSYGWLRAFGFNSVMLSGSLAQENRNKLLRFVNHPPMRAFILAGANSGDHVCSNLFYACTFLTEALPENNIGADNLTTIGTRFRNNQYYGCIRLPAAAAETLPPNVTTIATYFRAGQYQTCTALTVAAPEFLPPNVNTIDRNFRQAQYASTGLLVPAAEFMPSGVINISGVFRADQYAQCEHLKIGGHIHNHRFAAIIVDTAAEGGLGYFGHFRFTGTLSGADTMPRYYTDATQTASVPVTNITPAGNLGYVTNRTGIAGYDSLHIRWRS